jgi:hypothetical protein
MIGQLLKKTKQTALSPKTEVSLISELIRYYVVVDIKPALLCGVVLCCCAKLLFAHHVQIAFRKCWLGSQVRVSDRGVH